MQVLELDVLTRFVRRFAQMVMSRRPRHRPERSMHYGGCEFSVPQLLSEAILPSAPGCYAIQVRNWRGEMEPVHFGASHNLHEELLVDGPVGFVHWLSLDGSHRGVFVSYVRDEEDDHDKRHLEGMRLNRHYFPERTHSADEHLAHHRIHRVRRHPT
jgi:hypothetical protein